jgi:hypothetical protein
VTKPSKKYLEQLRRRYAQASKKERGQILDEFVKTTHYHRKHASALLHGKRTWRDERQPIQRKRRRCYTDEDKHTVLWLAELFDQISSKRLRAAMDSELPTLRQRKHLRVSAASYDRLQVISASTMDRMRRSVRRPLKRLRGGTKPGTLLKHQIPIRTFADWNEKQPGFVEADLVQHDGGNAAGFFATTLTLTDVYTGWTEMRATPNKAQTHVFAALKVLRSQLPFALRGIDSDNGAEFINEQLLRYCTDEQLTFTRGRVGRKNDNAFVESKNWSVVRRLIGYDRYDTLAQVKQLNELYSVYRLYVNHFLPVTKLLKTVRKGSRVQKIYDEPKTPYQRVLDSAFVSEPAKAQLHAIHAQLDVVKLRQQLDELLDHLVPSKAR